MPNRSWFAIVAILGLVLSACAAQSTPSSAPATPTAAAEQSATASVEASATESESPSSSESQGEEPAAGANELDWRLEPNFGSEQLAPNFLPDPFEVELVSGGPIDVSYLGDECGGFATAAPDFQVEYTAGTSDLLRFYFVADAAEDTTLVVNDAEGDWYCNDDADGTIDPMLQVDQPESGTYDVWVGSYDADEQIDGMLNITEISSNRP